MPKKQPPGNVDYTLCGNSSCPMADKCMRATKHYRDNVFTWQSFTRFEPKEGRCDGFVKRTQGRSKFGS